MSDELVITIRSKPGAGFECSDSRTQAVGIDRSMHGALLEWVAQAVKAGAFEDDSTPLLRPLRLVWPSSYHVVTQPFGANPELYARWKLPGHEGLDIRAPKGSIIYAAASGVVSEVGWRKPKHPYGYAIRLRHSFADGEYETIYAHLDHGSSLVVVGEAVIAHQAIALSDATGNVMPPGDRGAHLHFGLKRIGFKNGGYGELIDPLPFFVDPPE